MDIFFPQFGIMNIDSRKKYAGGKVCIIASVDVQYVFPRGSIKDVKQYVKNDKEAWSSWRRAYLRV